MDKKKLVRILPPEDLKGFEEFIEGQSNDTNFLPKLPNKKEVSFEHFTFLTNDSVRLTRLKELLSEKLPFTSKFEQGNFLLKEQTEEIDVLGKSLFQICDKTGSPYQKSLSEIFNSFFQQPKN